MVAFLLRLFNRYLKAMVVLNLAIIIFNTSNTLWVVRTNKFVDKNIDICCSISLLNSFCMSECCLFAPVSFYYFFYPSICNAVFVQLLTAFDSQYLLKIHTAIIPYIYIFCKFLLNVSNLLHMSQLLIYFLFSCLGLDIYKCHIGVCTVKI